ncbi:hypothetical protein NLJ89_g6960 [Agrocybe chaxingu]|uniref:Peptidase M43 pregnancy-associated plasma-A domain-containing protein n=1 Tax=Agrocybe chaxingu TaxID=84603 RepID=A0A9W8JY96_9AGAR|nr:hypothetical protein NLJ89_g6960 [Agrocybe chaxingu]
MPVPSFLTSFADKAQSAINASPLAAHRKEPLLAKAAPVTVHWNIIYRDTTVGGGYVPDSFIEAQMQVLNDDFTGSGISFALGDVQRIQNAVWFSRLGPYDTVSMENEMKRLYRKGGASTLNVYTVGFEVGQAAGLLGYATFPSDYASNSIDDGVVLHHGSVPGGSASPYNLGRTLTHEVGHWVGLYHTFQGGCTGTGDQVDDTPPEARSAFGCPVGRDTCPGGGADPIHNYMDYTDDSCMDHFTPGQITRLKAQVATYRQIVD